MAFLGWCRKDIGYLNLMHWPKPPRCLFWLVKWKICTAKNKQITKSKQAKKRKCNIRLNLLIYLGWMQLGT